MHLPIEESNRRITKLQSLLRDKNLDCALVYYDELAIANGWYLSGWCPQFESGMVFVPREGGAAILGGPESEPFARTDSAIKKTRNISVFMVPEEEYPNATIVTFDDALKELTNGAKLSRIGVVGYERIPRGTFQVLNAQLGDAALVDITRDFEDLRKIKSSYEIEQIRRSFEIADKAYDEVIGELKPGMKEYEIAAIAEYTARRMGMNDLGFKTVVASGARSNGCIPTASDRAVSVGDMLLFGFSFRYNGYCSVAGNTIIVDAEPNENQRRMLRDLAEALTLTKEMLTIGKSGREIDAPARKFFGKRGYLPYLICPFAHTIGLNEAEAPFWGPNSTDVIAKDMTVCIDVSFFGHPEFHGVRMETGYLITENGPAPLSPHMESVLLASMR